MIDVPPDCTQWPERVRQAEQPAALARAFDGQMECQRLAEAGWSPIATVARARREVRRISFRDGRLAFRIPSVALEREPDGGVFVSMSARGVPGSRKAEVPREVWDQTTGLHAEVRQVVRPRRWREGDPIPPLHCTTAVLEEAASGKAARRNISECVTEDREAFELAYRIAAVAVAYIPECTAAREKSRPQPGPGAADDRPMWALLDCGGRFEPQTLPID